MAPLLAPGAPATMPEEVMVAHGARFHARLSRALAVDSDSLMLATSPPSLPLPAASYSLLRCLADRVGIHGAVDSTALALSARWMFRTTRCTRSSAFEPNIMLCRIRASRESTLWWRRLELDELVTPRLHDRSADIDRSFPWKPRVEKCMSISSDRGKLIVPRLAREFRTSCSKASSRLSRIFLIFS